MGGMTPLTAMLVGTSGLCWTIVYILTIRRDFKDKTYGMPLVALAINFAWEFRFSIFCTGGEDFPLMVQIINTVWCLFDVVIVFTVFKFGYPAFEKEHKLPTSKFMFYGEFIGALIFCFIFVFVAVPFFQDLPVFEGSVREVAKFIAYGQNLLMSALFLSMYWHRGNLDGQSFWIAFFKWLGTFVVMFEYLPNHMQPLMWLVMISITLLDIWYMVTVWRACKAQGENPLKRW